MPQQHTAADSPEIQCQLPQSQTTLECAVPLRERTRGRWYARIGVACIGMAAALAFFELRIVRRPGGDSEWAKSITTRRFDVFYARSPLTVYLHQAAWHAVGKPMGASVVDTIAFSSALAGGIYVGALIGICSHWSFLLYVLAAPFTFLFFGHVENYAWVNALLAVYFLSVKRHFEGHAPLWPALLWLLAAASFHMLALFYAPTLFYAAGKSGAFRGLSRWHFPRPEARILLGIFGGWVTFLILARLVLKCEGTENNLACLVPLLLPANDTQYHFSMFSIDHVVMWFYFHWMSAATGLVGLVLFGWTLHTRREYAAACLLLAGAIAGWLGAFASPDATWRVFDRRTDLVLLGGILLFLNGHKLIRLVRIMDGLFDRFMLLAVGCGFLWTWIWHPDFGHRDWDLFANLALPLNILVGLIIAQVMQQKRKNMICELSAAKSDAGLHL